MDNELDKNVKEHEEYIRQIVREEIGKKVVPVKKIDNLHVLKVCILVGLSIIMATVSVYSLTQGEYLKFYAATVLFLLAASFCVIEIGQG